jgi:catechol 2,3-dioxygenase-like lactoylglutathione lyase family enzyme
VVVLRVVRGTVRSEGIVLAHFIVSDDVERSRRFYTEVLGGRVAFSGPGGLTYVALSNSWIIINVGGGPTDDKPAVTLETPRDPDRVSSFLNIRVKDIESVYADWSAPGWSIPDAAETAPVREALLHPRSRRSPDRSGADHGPGGGLVARPLAIGHARRGSLSAMPRSPAKSPHVDAGQSPRH